MLHKSIITLEFTLEVITTVNV